MSSKEWVEQRIKVMQAWLDGKEIEAKDVSSSTWGPIASPVWFPNCHYRIKPTKRNGWINIYADMSCGPIIFATKEDALRSISNTRYYINTTPIEWEE